MNSFAVIFLCFQACLIQNVFSQCTSRAAVLAEPGLLAPSALAGPYGLGAYDGLANWAGPSFSPAAAAFAPAGWASSTAASWAAPAAASFGAHCGAAPAYGGAGEGNVAVAGELPVAGTTAVTGQVPILGAVNFGGAIPAAGAVSISGQCACGCGSPY